MQYRHIAAAMFLAGTFTLVGCASENGQDAAELPENTDQGDQTGAGSDFSPDDVEALGGQGNVDYLTDLYQQAIAEDQTTITVYGITATSSASLYEQFSTRFPGITVDHVTIFGPELQNRISSEQTTGQYTADNVSVGGADALFVSENDYVAEQDPALGDELPDEYKPFGNTLFGANTYIYTVSYNTDLVDEAEAPRTFEELLDPKWHGEIAIGDVGTNIYGNLFGALYHDVIDETWVEEFAATDPVVVPSERDVFTAVSTGQVPIGLNNYIRGEDFLATDNLPVAFVADFEDGVGDGVFYRGTVQNAPNAIASDLLTAWWLTPEAMELLAIQGQAGLMPDAPSIVGQPPLSEMNINPVPSISEDYESKFNEGLELFRGVFNV